MKVIRGLATAALLVFGLVTPFPSAASLVDEWSAGFIRADGRHLEVDGTRIRLNAVNFSNFYYYDLTVHDLQDSGHHTEDDYAHVRELGFNSVRFAFRGDWYVESPEAFFAWLDQNIAWARQHGIRLILDLHVPAGSFWLDPTSPDVDFSIWTDPAIWKANVDLWRAIATRYVDEPAIAAYDILNEPVTVDADGSAWKRLAEEMIATIRSVDRNHLIIVGALHGVEGRYDVVDENRHFIVDDGNVMYDFHFYEPIKFTHQYASWMERPIKNGGVYPDPAVIMPTAESTILAGSRVATGPLVSGDSAWQIYDSGPVLIDDPAARAAMPIAVTRGGFEGTVYFDDISVIEYGPDRQFLRQIINEPLDRDDVLHWYPWQENGGAGSEVIRAREGWKDDASLAVTGPGIAAGADAVAGWSNHNWLFLVTPGNHYRIVGVLRGDAVDFGPGQGATLELDVYAATAGAPGEGFLARNADYLEHMMMPSLRFGMENNVPVSAMEFGIVSQTFESPEDGGQAWVRDVIGLFDKHDVSFAYWEYHGDRMGIFLYDPALAAGSGEPKRQNAGLFSALRDALPPLSAVD